MKAILISKTKSILSELCLIERCKKILKTRAGWLDGAAPVFCPRVRVNQVKVLLERCVVTMIMIK